MIPTPFELPSMSICFGRDGKTVDISPYEISLGLFKSQLCNTERRGLLFSSLEDVAHNLWKFDVVVEEFWIGGSFTSPKQEPNDIDAMLMLRFLEKPPSYQGFLDRVSAVENSPMSKISKGNALLDMTYLWVQANPFTNARHIAHWTNLYSYDRLDSGRRRPIYIVKRDFTFSQ